MEGGDCTEEETEIVGGDANSDDEQAPTSGGPGDFEDNDIQPPREGWSETFTGTAGVHEFTLGDDLDGVPYGPRVQADAGESDLRSPLYWFQRFWTPEMSNITVAQTNLYAFQRMAATAESDEQQPSRAFKSIDGREFHAFLAALISLGIPAQSNYKKAFQERNPLNIVQEAISLNRFEQILRFLHCCDNNKDDRSDPLFKIRKILCALNENCKSSWIISPICAIDEMDVGWRGLHKHKERITYKKAGDGFLIYALCDEGGYVFNFAVKFDPLWRRDIDGLPATFSAFLHLVDEMRMQFPNYQYGEIYADNLYSSIPLVQSLLKRKIYYCGTLRSNRKPLNFALNDEDPVGTIRQLHKGDITVMIWRPKKGKEVRMITSVHRPVKVTVVQRKKPTYDQDRRHFIRMFVDVAVPDCSKDYNFYMNAVDIADQLRSYYTTRRRTNKWWHRLFFFVLDTAICNAFVSYKRYWEIESERREQSDNVDENPTPPFRSLTHREFNTLLAEELLALSKGSGRKRKRSASSSSSSTSSTVKRLVARRRSTPGSGGATDNEVRKFLALHRLEKMVYRTTECSELSDSPRHYSRDCMECKIGMQERKRSVYFCTECNVGLHPQCYTKYHLSRAGKN
tara:strand:+ start:261 stop:2138 length:1878 start_codon:yes stop_codon:yes gene_type:complete